MALIVEDGTGLTTSEAYATVAEANTYFTARANDAWDALTTAEKEVALRKAADYLTQQYGGRWQGSRMTTTQALDWPRYGAYRHGYIIPSNTIPLELKRASFELAVRASAGELMPDMSTDSVVKRQKAGPLEIEYQDGSDSQPQETYTAVDKILEPLLGLGATGSVPVIRT